MDIRTTRFFSIGIAIIILAELVFVAGIAFAAWKFL
jgi:hypothetical protein